MRTNRGVVGIRGLFALSLLTCLAPHAAATTDLLVPRGSPWTYLDDGSDQGTAWKDPGFDDSSWASGPAQLGYGDEDEATEVAFGSDPDDKHTTTYFRHEFTVVDASLYTTVRLEVLRDDGAVVYLNGVEVARSNMPGGTITATTLASSTISGSDEDLYQVFAPAPSSLVTGVNLLAVEIHQSDVDSSDISFDLELEASDTEIITRGPYLQLGTPTGVIIRWNTDVASDTRVLYGTSPGVLDQVVVDPTITGSHLVSLRGLLPETKYYYAVGTSSDVLAGPDPEQFFITPPSTGIARPTRVWVIGDSGTADLLAATVRDAYTAFTGATHTNLWLMLGDNAYTSGTNAEYQAAVYDMYPDMLRKSVLWPTRGNHDSTGAYLGTFELPAAGEAGGLASGTESYYSFDHGNIHFVCLDSFGSSLAVGGAMWTWVQADLAATDQDWIVAYWHHPPYSKGSHDSDTEATLISMREDFVPLLESGGVDLVLCGHSHSYERSFLIDGHYGDSSSFVGAMKVDGGDGSVGGSGAYTKLPGPNNGTVYAVAGSSGKLGDGDLDHPAMVHVASKLGSLVLDVDGNAMDVTFLDSTGAIEDDFTIFHGPLGSWDDVGGGSPGVAGVPLLEGFGSQLPDSTLTMQLTNAAPNALSIMFLADSSIPTPFLGGTLHAFPVLTQLRLFTDATGTLYGATNWPSGLPSGTQFWYQCGVVDASAAFGAALSNGLRSTTP